MSDVTYPHEPNTLNITWKLQLNKKTKCDVMLNSSRTTLEGVI